MNDELKKTIESLKEAQKILKQFSTREEAIEYLVKETNLQEEECANAYDLLIKIDCTKNIEQ